MSNSLSVRRVKVQSLHEDGSPDGEPTYGVMAADNEEQAYIDIYDSFEELNQAIVEAGSIIACVAGGEQFAGLCWDGIGTDNFYGVPGSYDDDADDGEEADDDETD